MDTVKITRKAVEKALGPFSGILGTVSHRGGFTITTQGYQEPEDLKELMDGFKSKLVAAFGSQYTVDGVVGRYNGEMIFHLTLRDLENEARIKANNDRKAKLEQNAKFTAGMFNVHYLGHEDTWIDARSYLWFQRQINAFGVRVIMPARIHQFVLGAERGETDQLIKLILGTKDGLPAETVQVHNTLGLIFVANPYRPINPIRWSCGWLNSYEGQIGIEPCNDDGYVKDEIRVNIKRDYERDENRLTHYTWNPTISWPSWGSVTPEYAQVFLQAVKRGTELMELAKTAPWFQEQIAQE